MPFCRRCSNCGRKCDKPFYFTQENDKPLCSFCMDSKRRMWKAKTEDAKKGYKINYCQNCGAKVPRNVFYMNGNFCSDCYTLKVQSDAVRNKLHEEVKQNE